MWTCCCPASSTVMSSHCCCLHFHGYDGARSRSLRQLGGAPWWVALWSSARTLTPRSAAARHPGGRRALHLWSSASAGAQRSRRACNTASLSRPCTHVDLYAQTVMIVHATLPDVHRMVRAPSWVSVRTFHEFRDRIKGKSLFLGRRNEPLTSGFKYIRLWCPTSSREEETRKASESDPQVNQLFVFVLYCVYLMCAGLPVMRLVASDGSNHRSRRNQKIVSRSIAASSCLFTTTSLF